MSNQTRYFLNGVGADMVGGRVGGELTRRIDIHGICGTNEICFSVNDEFVDEQYDLCKMTHHVALTEDMFYVECDWYITFGRGHHGENDESLYLNYMKVYGSITEVESAVANRISCCANYYPSRELAGVDLFGLKEVPEQKVTYKPFLMKDSDYADVAEIYLSLYGK